MDIIALLSYTIPAVIVALLAYYFFNKISSEEEKRRRFVLMKDLRKETIPIRLQAYERLVLLLERIDVPRLISRIPPKDLSKETYLQSLIITIEKEFEHNISQQLYVTTDCWRLIQSTKSSIVAIISKTAIDNDMKTGKELKMRLLEHSSEHGAISSVALTYLKDEAKKLW